MKATTTILAAAAIVAVACAADGDCNSKDSKVPKRYRKNLKTKNKYQRACETKDNCSWNYNKKRCVTKKAGCKPLMKHDCDLDDSCLWRPNKEGNNWGTANLKGSVQGLCEDKPAGYDPNVCEFMFKSDCIAADHCGYSKKRTPKCQEKAGYTAAPTPPPTVGCNPNAVNGLVCQNGDVDTDGLTWNFCGEFANRKYCPIGWARCADGKCMQGTDASCGGNGGLDISYVAC